MLHLCIGGGHDNDEWRRVVQNTFDRIRRSVYWYISVVIAFLSVFNMTLWNFSSIQAMLSSSILIFYQWNLRLIHYVRHDILVSLFFCLLPISEKLFPSSDFAVVLALKGYAIDSLSWITAFFLEMFDCRFDEECFYSIHSAIVKRNIWNMKVWFIENNSEEFDLFYKTKGILRRGFRC